MTKIDDYDLWYADYMTTPQTPYMYRFWQYTDSGTVPGISGAVDLDVELIPKSELVQHHGIYLLDALQQAVSGDTSYAAKTTSKASDESISKDRGENCGIDLIRKENP